MIHKKYFVYFFIGCIILWSLVFVSSQSERINIHDSYSFDGSSFNDQVAFENYGFSFQATDIDYSADPDLVCFNVDLYKAETEDYSTSSGEITMDYCIYSSSTDRDDCINYWGINLPLSNMELENFLDQFLNQKVCDGCDYDTSNRFGDSVEVDIFYDCDASSKFISAIGNYFVINPREYYCLNNGDDEYRVSGRTFDWYSNKNIWVDYDIKECIGDRIGCAEDRDEINDNTGTTYLPDVCAIKDGSRSYCYGQDDLCISRNCGGGRIDFSSQCASDGSDAYFLLTEEYRDTCGGDGDLQEVYSEYITCSEDLGSDYICDVDKVGQDIASPSIICKLKEYSSCNIDSECWNDNGGYDCMGNTGNKICTMGANGKNCYSNDDAQCDSFRCDNTCQSKLTDGLSCDENSDCINGQCGGGICGGTGVTVDLAVVDINPVQVIPNVDLVKGKFGIVRITVANYGSNQSNGLVNVTFDGAQLNIASGDTQTKPIPPNRNITFDFDFTPTSSGDNKEIIANVSVV